MSGVGVLKIGSIDGCGLNVVVIVGIWYEMIFDGLIVGVQCVLDEVYVMFCVVWVFGLFEFVVVVQVVFVGGVDVVVVLGVIICGGILYFEYVFFVVIDGLMCVLFDVGKLVGFGLFILDDEQQGFDCVGLEGFKEDKGVEVVDVVLWMVFVIWEFCG